MVLRGDEHSAAGKLLDGLVGAAMAVVQLFGFAAAREREQLVAETDAEQRQTAFAQLFELLNNRGVLLGISGAVGQHDAVGLERENFLRRGMGRHYRDLAVALVELASDVVLGAEIHDDNVVVLFVGVKNLGLLNGGAFHRLHNLVVLQRLHLLVGDVGRVLNFAVEHAVFAHDARQGASVDTADTGNALAF